MANVESMAMTLARKLRTKLERVEREQQGEAHLSVAEVNVVLAILRQWAGKR